MPPTVANFLSGTVYENVYKMTVLAFLRQVVDNGRRISFRYFTIPKNDARSRK